MCHPNVLPLPPPSPQFERGCRPRCRAGAYRVHRSKLHLPIEHPADNVDAQEMRGNRKGQSPPILAMEPSVRRACVFSCGTAAVRIFFESIGRFKSSNGHANCCRSLG